MGDYPQGIVIEEHDGTNKAHRIKTRATHIRLFSLAELFTWYYISEKNMLKNIIF